MDAYESLRQFIELSHVLHFGRAARACHVSPSALSRSIQRLETQLGEHLFERAHHRVTLTAAGDAFRRHALAVLEDWHRHEGERAGSRGELAGTVRVYCSVTAAQSIVPDLIARVRRQHPRVRVELETGYAADALERLRGGDIDVTVAPLPSRLPAGMRSRVIDTTPVIFVGPSMDGPSMDGRMRDAMRRRPVDWPNLPLVLPAAGLARELADAWLRRRGIAPNIYAEIQGHEAILSLVALGCGVGVVPKLVLEKSALQDRIVELRVRPALPKFQIALCVHERSLRNPLVAAVWEA
jgi:LysR family positive regulator for ilvC